MRSLPHITIACCAVWAGCRLLRSLPRQTVSPSPDPERNGAGRELPPLADAVDYRLVAVGSLLPDMVDRGLRAAAGGGSWSRDQHLLGHTLLLNSPLILAGIGLATRHQDVKLLAIGAAAMTHLLVDPVIRSPRTLLWPLLGVAFPEARGLNRPLTLLTQVTAAAVILATVLGLQRKGRLQDFIVSGRL